MQDDLVAIRLPDLKRLFRKYKKWPAFRLAVIDAAVVKVDDGKGHPEPKPTDVGPSYV